ncbi:MAG: DegT/DnrJ/EryC1/StrS aminotransferase family protein [candidate division NC10 bacterium]|nr:DegT/DnrJ/EryC1/StrS aminotransferase family protein [candidate division NC10 bacterium]
MSAVSVIPHSRPTLGPEDRRAVSAALASSQLAQGPYVAEFEARLAGLTGAAGAVATSSGTAALHLALVALGIGPGDDVILPSYVCAGPLHAIQHTGATPLLVDCDPHTYNLDPIHVKRTLTRRTKAILAPHLFGLPADLAALLSLGVPIIEDCAQALGATYQGRPVGGIGTLGICSFYATKVITTGEGGMLLSSDADLLHRARDLRDYDERPTLRTRFNYKLTDFQAALGLSQLQKLPDFLAKRRALAARYHRRLQDLPLIIPFVPADRDHIFYRYVVRVTGGLKIMLTRLAQAGVTARRPVFRPLHRYLNLTGFPGTEEVWQTALSLPIYPTLGNDIVRVIRAVRAIFSGQAGDRSRQRIASKR